jgi:hypothetical protein
MMDWDSLFEPYGWDDCAAADDTALLAERIERFVRRQGVELSLTPARLARQILEYVWMRQGLSAYEIARTQNPAMPAGWKTTHERLWVDWIWHVFTLDDWQNLVVSSVFGTDVRSWEPEGWREEIFEFLPAWIARSMPRFEEIDVTPLPEPEPEDMDPRLAKIDPYLLEHGKRGRRIKGLRVFE